MSIPPHPLPNPLSSQAFKCSPSSILSLQNWRSPGSRLLEWRGALPPPRVGLRACSHHMPKASQFFVSSGLLTLPPTSPGHRQGRGVPGSGADRHVPGLGGTSALTSRYRPRAGGDEGGTVSQPWRHSTPVSRERLCGRPSPAWGRAAGARRAWFVRPNYYLSGLPELQDSVTFSAETSPLAARRASFLSRPPLPSASPGPPPREAGSQGLGRGKWGLGRARPETG